MIKINKINGYFDKIFCINLDRRNDRWKLCLEEFSKHNMIVERFSAVDGSKIKNKNDWMTGPRIGCCKSHANILKKMVENNWKNILILEDDVQFIENFNNVFCDRMAFVPSDYDIFYLCGNMPENLEKINQHISKTTGVLSTGAYAMSLNFAKYIIPKIEVFTDPVDNIYKSNTPGRKCYISQPYMCKQRVGFSDIEGRVTDYSGVINI